MIWVQGIPSPQCPSWCRCRNTNPGMILCRCFYCTALGVGCKPKSDSARIPQGHVFIPFLLHNCLLIIKPILFLLIFPKHKFCDFHQRPKHPCSWFLLPLHHFSWPLLQLNNIFNYQTVITFNNAIIYHMMIPHDLIKLNRFSFSPRPTRPNLSWHPLNLILGTFLTLCRPWDVTTVSPQRHHNTWLFLGRFLWVFSPLFGEESEVERGEQRILSLLFLRRPRWRTRGWEPAGLQAHNRP